MKKITIILSILLFSFTTKAQNPLEVGQMQFNAGLGFSDVGVPVYFGLDYGVHEDISVGGELSFRRYRQKFLGNRYSHNVIGISGNANYHFNRILEIPSNFDFYAGLSVGFFVWNSPENFRGDQSSELGLGLQVGGRYYFNEKVGINLEFGGGNAVSGGKIGISIKL